MEKEVLEKIIEEMGMENVNSYEELISELINSKDGIRKIAVFQKNYFDEKESFQDDLQNLKEEYVEKFDSLDINLNKLENSWSKAVIDYNDVNSELIFSSKNSSGIVYELRTVDERLAEINKDIELLNGKTPSRKLQEEIKALNEKKEELEKNKLDAKNVRDDIKVEINNYEEEIRKLKSSKKYLVEEKQWKENKIK